jgi:uncharacterized protein (DUF362 family)
MAATVAVVRIKEDYRGALNQAIQLVGGIADLNTAEREVTIKVGIFDPRAPHHTCLPALQAIAEAFDRSPRIYLAESDNYVGKALNRMEKIKEGFSEQVIPFSLSDDPDARDLTIAGEVMAISPVLCKPNVLVSTHVLRTFARGSILKNLFGCTPMAKKARFHKTEIFNNLLIDLFQAAGGIDLAVMDGTKLFHGGSGKYVLTDVLIVGRDAVAVETVGAIFAGLKPEKMEFLQEFGCRGLGEVDPQKIDIVGIAAAELDPLRHAHKQLKKLVAAEPRKPGISDTIDLLVEEGWLNELRCVPEIVTELQERGVKNAAQATVKSTLERRLGKTVEKVKNGRTLAYRRKAG